MIWPFHPVVPNEVLAMRTAPGCTNFAACPTVKYSASRETLPSGCSVSRPVQVSQPPRCGPPVQSSAMFQFAVDLAQFRVVPMMIVRACQVSVPRKICSGVSVGPCEPEHSVNQIPLPGWASCSAVCALGSPK
jgi:hypothetical protein